MPLAHSVIYLVVHNNKHRPTKCESRGLVCPKSACDLPTATYAVHGWYLVPSNPALSAMPKPNLNGAGMSQKWKNRKHPNQIDSNISCSMCWQLLCLKSVHQHDSSHCKLTLQNSAWNQMVLTAAFTHSNVCLDDLSRTWINLDVIECWMN